MRGAAALIEQHGSNVWFEKSAADLWAKIKPKGWLGPEAVSKSADTLDVWIDSGSSSRAVLACRPELQHTGAQGKVVWQADMYLEGSDQHRGWFQSSLLLSLAGNGAPPYKTVLTHGFMVDADREKISKSKEGAYEKPQTAEAYIKKYGADVVRLWVASQDYRNDIIVSDERINKVSETYRGLRNTIRYQLSNLYDFDPVHHLVEFADMTGLDRWILRAFAKLEQEVFDAYRRYEFHVAYQKISQFAAVELSVIEDFVEGTADEIPFCTISAAAFAVIYKYRDTDIIPDSIPEWGHADDSSVVRAVLIEHERVLAAFAAKIGVAWSKITVNP